MSQADYLLALARAAEPVLRVIEADKRRAPRRLWPLFDRLAELLFEPGLDLNELQKEAGFNDPEIFADLRSELGQPPWGYLRDLRLETAARLLLESEIAISEIGRLVGWSSPSTFRRTLKDFLGTSASEYRRQAPRLLERVGSLPPGAEAHEYWQRMEAGELSDEEARALDATLGRLAPSPAPRDDRFERWAAHHRTLAEAIADALDALPFADQRRLARHAVVFPDDAFFEELGRRSRAADGDRAVELALLAVDCLAASGTLDEIPALAALAWARVALARWRGGDLTGAEGDLERSARDLERALEAKPPVLHPIWEAERARVEGAFHWLRGRRIEALQSADRALALERHVGGIELTRALVLRAEVSAAIADSEPDEELPPLGLKQKAELPSALADLEEARSQLASSTEAEQAAALALWVRLLALAGDRGEILTALGEIRRWASALGNVAAGLVPWLEGHTTSDPEPLWHEARERFTARGDDLAAARTTLDLARHFLAHGRATDAAVESARLATALGALAASRQDLAVLDRLAQPPSSADLDAADRVLRRLEWQRRAQRALDVAGASPDPGA